MRINLGCGHRKIDDFVNVDNSPACSPDVVHDLTMYPWPFEDDCAEEIICSHVLEHLIHQGNAEEFFAFFRECWRIMKSGGGLQIAVPNATGEGAFADPWHKSAWSKGIFAFISKDSIAYNVQRKTRMSPIELDFDFCIQSLDEVNGDIRMVAVAIK